MRHLNWVLISVLALSVAFVRADTVGLVTFVIGAPQAQTKMGLANLLKGDEIAPGSRVITGEGDHMHIRFVDGTLVSVRPSSVLSIDSFAVDNEEVKSFRLTLDQGIIRTISGDVLKSNQERFRLNTPIAAIGIRGTDFTTQTDLAETRVRVHSGEVVMSPLGSSCIRDELGPCMSDSALSLAAGTDDTLRLRVGGLPELLRLTTDPNQAVPADGNVPNEANLSEASLRSRKDRQLVPINERPELQPFIDTETDLSNQTGPLIWGHWWAKPSGDSWSIPAGELLSRYEPTVSNRYYGLFRTPEHSGIVNPSQARVVLGLTAADATLDYNFSQTPATVTSGYLLLDFEARAFMSELTIDTDRLKNFSLNGIGFISPTGVFISRSSSDRMAGAMTVDGSSAGMLFEKTFKGGSVSGISLWSE